MCDDGLDRHGLCGTYDLRARASILCENVRMSAWHRKDEALTLNEREILSNARDLLDHRAGCAAHLELSLARK